jgi:hypothetical protein
MRRKLFLAAAFLSLLLCAGCAWWWIGSSKRMDQFTWQTRGGQAVRVLGSDGKLMLTRTLTATPPESVNGQITWGSIPYAGGSSPGEPQLQWTSFSYTTRPLADKAGGHEATLILPAWAVVSTFGLLPLMWGVAKVKPAKKKAH